MKQLEQRLRNWNNLMTHVGFGLEEWKQEPLDELLKLSSGVLNRFHLYSLGLKYYSFLEREKDEIQYNKDGNVVETICPEVVRVRRRLNEVIVGLHDDMIIPDVVEMQRLKDVIEEHVHVLVAYGEQMELLESIYNTVSEENHDLTCFEKDEAFARYVCEIVMALEDAMEIREHLTYIYQELPVRIHKNKFLGMAEAYIERFRGIPLKDVQAHIQMLNEKFNPKSIQGYGRVATDIFDDLERAEKIMLDKVDQRNEEIYQQLFLTMEQKNSCIEYALDCVEIINHCMGLGYTAMSEEIDETEYQAIVQLLDINTSDEALDSIFEMVEENYEILLETMVYIDSFLERSEELEGDVLPEYVTERLYYLKLGKLLAREGYFNEDPRKEVEEIPSHKEFMLVKRGWVHTLEETLKQENRLLQRARMSRLLGVFNILHETGQEIYDYIYYALKECNNTAEKVNRMQAIRDYLKEYIDVSLDA